MQLITLNIWGGHVKNELLDFIQSNRDVDFFCLQEVYHQAKEKVSDENRVVHLDIYNEIDQCLPNHQGYFRPTVNNIYGICTFVKKSINVISENAIMIHRNEKYIGIGPSHSRNLQWLHCIVNDKKYCIANVHCLWNGKGKGDSDARIEQSKIISEFMYENKHHNKILCGDFNLRPDTKSLAIIENGLRNLVIENNVKSTRTKLYPKQEQFADYIFTSDQIIVRKFKVLDDVVSDHAPLILEFD